MVNIAERLLMSSHFNWKYNKIFHIAFKGCMAVLLFCMLLDFKNLIWEGENKVSQW